MKNSQFSQQVQAWSALVSAYTSKIPRPVDATGRPGFALSLIGREPRQVMRLTGNKKGNASVCQQSLRQKFWERTQRIATPNKSVGDAILRNSA
jgi:hypothetical protein